VPKLRLVHMETRPQTSVPTHALRAVLVAITAALATLALTDPAPAGAARSLTGCFVGQSSGSGIVTTALETRAPGGWRFVGGVARTNPNGCIRYDLKPAWQRLPLRIRAIDPLAGGDRLRTAATTMYAKPGGGAYALGTGILRSVPAPLVVRRPEGSGDGAAPAAACPKLEAGSAACWLQQPWLASHGSSIPALRR
jgi:hypothetical protein